MGIYGRKGARFLPGQTRRGLASQPSGTEAEKNGYRSEMSPGGGPACARCQEASYGTETFQQVLNKSELTCNVTVIPDFLEPRILSSNSRSGLCASEAVGQQDSGVHLGAPR
ncbi:hypothetical protein Q8A73_009932 [Channa argus]|nr:hypothetical protein Q8A73_009932 [Channa argus]